jgi:hypothetical protein
MPPPSNIGTVLIAELEQMANPTSPPEPEPTEVVYVEEKQGPPKLDYPVLRSWFPLCKEPRRHADGPRN